MTAFEWTTDLIVIATLLTIVVLALGFAIGKLISQPIINRLTIENDQNKELAAQHAELKQEKQLLSDEVQQLEIKMAELNVQLQTQQGKVVELKQETDKKQQQLQQEQDKSLQLTADYTELKTSLSEREKNFQEQLLNLSESKAQLSKEFENLANKILTEKSKAFSVSNSEQINTLLTPFREQIEGFQKRVNEVHDASIKGNSNLSSEIKKVLDIGLQMSDEANNLTTALKGDAKQRGIWGEVQLERTLQLSGLREKDHYDYDQNYKSQDGRNQRPDYLIKLPDDKHIIIDSKLSLVAYERAVNAESPEESALFMKQHIEAVRTHIEQLSAKDYTNLIGVHSPSFVLMFMPIEPAYIEAMKQNRELFEYGYSKGIVLVSHTTLIPILRTVSNLWMIERSNAEAKLISDKAGDIYNTVCTLAERLQKLGSSLKAASNNYNSTVRSLVGQQGLYGRVDKFTELSSRISKSLPDVTTQELDYDAEQVQLVVEEIHENQLEDDTSVILEDKRQVDKD